MPVPAWHLDREIGGRLPDRSDPRVRSWWRRAPLAWVGEESGNVLLRFVLVLLAALAIGPLPVAAQVATPERDALGHASAPFGLASITLPTGETGIRATFAAMPQAIDGLPRSTVVESAGRIQITCGDGAPARSEERRVGRE